MLFDIGIDLKIVLSDMFDKGFCYWDDFIDGFSALITCMITIVAPNSLIMFG
jgi:hypothetical protein